MIGSWQGLAADLPNQWDEYEFQNKILGLLEPSTTLPWIFYDYKLATQK